MCFPNAARDRRVINFIFTQGARFTTTKALITQPYTTRHHFNTIIPVQRNTLKSPDDTNAITVTIAKHAGKPLLLWFAKMPPYLIFQRCDVKCWWHANNKFYIVAQQLPYLTIDNLQSGCSSGYKQLKCFIFSVACIWTFWILLWRIRQRWSDLAALSKMLLTIACLSSTMVLSYSPIAVGVVILLVQ